MKVQGESEGRGPLFIGKEESGFEVKLWVRWWYMESGEQGFMG